ncbi:MAG: hypothetical protein NTX40_03885, partial [Planctomycetota bacterium]|nr:hypothetical protein [Planctomycetota bacterium]
FGFRLILYETTPASVFVQHVSARQPDVFVHDLAVLNPSLHQIDHLGCPALAGLVGSLGRPEQVTVNPLAVKSGAPAL